MTRDNPLTEPVAPRPARSAPLRRGLCALWAAWTCIGPFRAGPAARAVPPGDILWALPWLGLILGVLWTVIFAGAWRLFGERAGLRLVPSLAIVLADLLLAGRFYMAGVRMAESLAQREPAFIDQRRRDISAVGVFVIVALVVMMYTLLLAVPRGFEWWPGDWRHVLHWTYPQPVFRPLVLMPLWACWSVVLAAAIGRARSSTLPADAEPLARLAGQATLAQVFIGFLPALVITAIYCSLDGNVVIGLGVSLVVFLSAYIAAMAAALHWRGQNDVTVLTAGLLGRIAFLLCWLFVGFALHGW